MSRVILSLFLLGMSFCGWGEIVTEHDAKLVAVNWLNSKGKPYSDNDIDHVFIKTLDDIAAFYIINFSPDGWVMVAATDKVEPILAYSLNSNFYTNNIPIQVEEWLDGIGREVESSYSDEYQPALYLNNKWDIYKNKIIEKPSLKSSSAISSVGPLLSCTWNQGRYHNEKAPLDPASLAGNGHVWIGCVATAYSQIMKFWEYPGTGLGSHSYTHDKYGLLSANFGESSYDWASMPNNLTQENEEVQEICYHAAVAVDMDFDPVGSGAFLDDTQIALIKYFKYNATIFNPDKNSWDSELEWKSVLRKELDKGRPLIYAGYNLGGKNGHAFVMDGYTDDFFHFNWGWGGNANGNYLLSALTPSGSNYSYNQSALLGIEPIINSVIPSPYSEDFETKNSGKISLFGMSNVSSEERHSGENCIQLSHPTFSSYSQNTAALTFVVPENGQLSFWVKRYTGDISPFNKQKAVIMAGEKDTILYEIYKGSFNDNDWKNYKIDLSKYGGKLVRFLVIQQNFDFYKNQWMYLDDVSITDGEQNLEPIIPANPYPENEALKLDFEPTLKWAGGDKNGDSVNYSIYFGTTENPPLVAVVSENQFVPGLLNHSTTYYWKVISNDGELQSEGPIWSFTTHGIPPNLEICGYDNLTSTSISVCGNIVNNNGSIISSSGICWSKNPDPTFDNNKCETEISHSTFNCQINILEPFTNYYFRAYAYSNEGLGYSSDVAIKTKAALSEVKIKRVTNIFRTSATVSASIKKVNDSLITSRGVVWSLNEDFASGMVNKVTQTGSWGEALDFSVQIEGIPGPAKIYYAVFVENSVGISYSDTSMFEVVNTAPTIDLDYDNSSGKLGQNFMTSIAEQQTGGNVVDFDVTLSDVYSDTIQLISLVLTNQVFDKDEYLFLPDEKFNISIKGNNTDTILLTNTGFINNDELEKILSCIEYRNNNDAPNSDIIREIKIQINDGFDNSNIATSFIKVISINDAPVNQTLPKLNSNPNYGAVVSVVQGVWADIRDNCNTSFNYKYRWQKKNGDKIIDIKEGVFSQLFVLDSLCGNEIRVIETVIDNNCGGENVATDSIASIWYEVGKVEQTLVFDQIPMQYFSYNPLVLTGYASSGSPLTFETTSTDIIEISNDSVFYKKTGFAIVSSYQKGDACYFPSDTITRMLNIKKGVQQINVEPFNSVKISEQFRIFNALSSAGLPITVESSDTLIAYVRNDSILFSGLGVVELTFSQNGNAYIGKAEELKFKIEVLKGDQHITVNMDTVFQYGSEFLSYSALSSSSLLLETGSSDLSIIEVDGNRLRIKGVGSCELTFKQAGNDFYYPAETVRVNIRVIKGEQLVDFKLDNELRYGNNYNFNLNLSSKLQPVLSSQNTSIIDIQNNKLIINGVGSTAIVCRHGGNDLWNELDTLIELHTNKGLQSINVNDSILVEYSDAEFEIDADLNSGLPVLFSIDDSLLVSFVDGKFVINGVGTTKIKSFQDGNDLWERTEKEIHLTVLKGNQTITFEQPANFKFGIDTFELNALASSGLDVTFESRNTDVAEIDGNRIIIHKAGTAQIEAMQKGNNYWEMAEPVSRQIIIDKANQIISKNISDTLFTNQNILFSNFISSSGLTISEIVSSNKSIIDVNADAISIKDKGSVSLDVSQLGDHNYLPATARFTFSILHPLNVSEFENAVFSIFPNPTTNIVHLTIEGQVEYPLQLSLLNTLGQIQLKQLIERPFTVLDLSEISSGIYFIVIRSDKYYRIEKLIVK